MELTNKLQELLNTTKFLEELQKKIKDYKRTSKSTIETSCLLDKVDHYIDEQLKCFYNDLLLDKVNEKK